MKNLIDNYIPTKGFVLLLSEFIVNNFEESLSCFFEIRYNIYHCNFIFRVFEQFTISILFSFKILIIAFNIFYHTTLNLPQISIDNHFSQFLVYQLQIKYYYLNTL